MHFDEDLIEMFKEMDDFEEGPTKEKLIEQYFTIKDEIGKKPKPSDINEHGRYKISAYNSLFGGWLAFLKEIGEATKASYHYHQGVHLGHLFFVVNEVGSGNFEGYLEKEKIYPSVGQLSGFGRQVRYKIWAAMEIGLIEDDRKPGASDLTYQTLTDKGRIMFDVMQKHQRDMPGDFYDFRTDSKAELSWSMIKNEQFYNQFFRKVLCSKETDKQNLLNIFLGFMAIKHMCKYIFHVSQSKTIQRSDLYSNYFKTPFIESYFERHGIVQDSEEGAKRRLPFIINILEACGIVTFTDRSTFQVNNLPIMSALFSEDIEDTSGAMEHMEIVKKFYYNRRDEIDMDSEEVVQLRTWFGRHFLTDEYFVDGILLLDGVE